MSIGKVLSAQIITNESYSRPSVDETNISSSTLNEMDRKKRKEELENRMLAMFEKFMVYDGESGRDLIDGNRLTTRDKESIIKDCFDALISKYNGVLNIDEKVVDDTVVLNTILFLINDKKMDPFEIIYKFPLELNTRLIGNDASESGSQSSGAGIGIRYSKIYVNYIDGSREDSIEFIKGDSAEKTARSNYNKRLAQY